MRTHKVEAMYGRSCINVKVEPRSTSAFTDGLSYIVSVLFTHVKFNVFYLTVEIHLKTGHIFPRVNGRTGLTYSTATNLYQIALGSFVDLHQYSLDSRYKDGRLTDPN